MCRLTRYRRAVSEFTFIIPQNFTNSLIELRSKSNLHLTQYYYQSYLIRPCVVYIDKRCILDYLYIRPSKARKKKSYICSRIVMAVNYMVAARAQKGP